MSEIDSTPFVPDCITPVQWASLHDAHELSPERRLLLAMLEDALRLVTGQRYNAEEYVAQKYCQMRAEAWDWINDTSAEPWGTFVFTCEHLGIDGGAIRKHLASTGARFAARSPLHPCDGSATAPE